MNIEFYFDPSCPFCWITSRWLLQVAEERDVNIAWLAFSLALKNNDLEGKSIPHGPAHAESHRLLKVMLAAEEKYQTPLVDLYTSAGTKHHIGGQEFSDDFIKEFLDQQKLPKDLIEAADQTTYDKKLQTYIDQAVTVAGKDIGVPVIVFTNISGTKQGFFGPVLQTLPNKVESLSLWDGLSKLATSSSFYELKRGRPHEAPDVASTAK